MSRPILVAAAGGASRAGFFTASIIGYPARHGEGKGPSAPMLPK